MILDGIPVGVRTSLVGRWQEVELAGADGHGRVAWRRGPGEELRKREALELDEDAAEGKLRVEEALTVDDGSPGLANAPGDGAATRRSTSASTSSGKSAARSP